MRAWHVTVGIVVGALLVACGGSGERSGGDAVAPGSDGYTARDTPVGPGSDLVAGEDVPGPGPDTPPPVDVPATCTGDERICDELGRVLACVGGAWAAPNPCPDGQICQLGHCAVPFECTPGEVRGCLSETARAVCTPDGHAYVEEACAPGLWCVQGVCGTQLCQPLTTKCDGLFATLQCSAGGDAWGNPTPCGEGAVCRDGACTSGCEAAIKLSSYIGCEYWTVDLDNYHDPATNPKPDEVPHAIVVSNPGEIPATVQFQTGSGLVITFADPVVPPGEARSFEMPRYDIDGSGISNRSIRMLSSFPVNAYQFNPLNNEGVASNDGSLLLPANTLGRQYIVASWPTGPDPGAFFPGTKPQHGYFTIVATSPGETHVTIQVAGNVEPGPGINAMTTGQTAMYTLAQFQVLSMEAVAADMSTFRTYDLTGSVVSSDQPIAVFGGHEEAVIGYKEGETCCADHLEEQLLPVEVWTNDILCAKIRPRTASGEVDFWRIFSGENGNVIHTDPPIPTLDGRTLDYGKWIEVKSEISFEVHGTGPVMAVQYLVSQGQTDDYVGDPSMIVSVPMGQFRNDYTILVPDGYDSDWVSVIRPATMQVKVDGVPTTVGFTPFGTGAWELGYVPLEPGVHTLFGALPFGLIAFGWDTAVSYGYPAGLNLRAADWMP